MKNDELLTAVCVQSGTAHMLAEDIRTAVLAQGCVLKGEALTTLLQVRERLQQALAAAVELECLARASEGIYT